MANGSHSSSYVPQVNSSSGQVFDWRRVWQQLRDAGDEIKEDARQILLDAAEGAAREAGPLLPAYRRKTTRYPKTPTFGPTGNLRRQGFRVREISRFRLRVSSVERYANFVDSQPTTRRLAGGRNRGIITPTPVIGRVAPKWRAWMFQQMDALCRRHDRREIR